MVEFGRIPRVLSCALPEPGECRPKLPRAAGVDNELQTAEIGLQGKKLTIICYQEFETNEYAVMSSMEGNGRGNVK
jgi:hypothetical protein